MRGAIVLGFDALALLLLSELLPGFVLDGPGAALGTAAVMRPPFVRMVGVSPGRYRPTVGAREAG